MGFILGEIGKSVNPRARFLVVGYVGGWDPERAALSRSRRAVARYDEAFGLLRVAPRPDMGFAASRLPHGSLDV